MSEDTTAPDGEVTTETAETETEKSVPYERFEKVNKQAKEAKAQAAQMAKDIADLRAQMEQRESAGLPELERLKKDMERAEKRAADAEAKAADADSRLARTTKERWVTAAAKDFTDPADAVAFVDLDTIEDEKDAERAVKRLAGQKKHLLKNEDPVLPGRVLQNGQTTAVKPGGFDLENEAQKLADGLKQFASKP
jgi:chromosome segregation ATPase